MPFSNSTGIMQIGSLMFLIPIMQLMPSHNHSQIICIPRNQCKIQFQMTYSFLQNSDQHPDNPEFEMIKDQTSLEPLIFVQDRGY